MVQETPIPLRLHHLDNIQQILLKGLQEYERSFRQHLSAMATDLRSPTFMKNHYDQVVGDSNNEDNYATANLIAYATYLNLDDQVLIDLIPRDKDLICDTCFNDEHCFNKLFYVSEAGLADRLESCIIANGLIGLFEKKGSILEHNFHVITTMGLIKTILTTDQHLMSF